MRTVNLSEDRLIAEYLAFRAREATELSVRELKGQGIDDPIAAINRPGIIAFLGSCGILLRPRRRKTKIEVVPLPPMNGGPSRVIDNDSSKDYFYFPREADFIRQVMENRDPVFVTGPMGCGKTTLLERLAASIVGNGKPVYRMSLNGETCSEDFYGTRELEREGTVFRPGPALRAMTMKRPLIINELDAASPAVLFSLQELPEGKPIRLTMINDAAGDPVEIDPWGPDPETGEPSGFLLAATANTQGQGDASGLYRGTQVLNAAFLDRWVLFTLDYPPRNEEWRLLVRRTGVAARTAERIVTVASLARRACDSSNPLTNAISIRQTLLWAKFVARLGWSEEQAFCVAIAERCNREDRATLAEMYQRVFGKAPDLDCIHAR